MDGAAASVPQPNSLFRPLFFRALLNVGASAGNPKEFRDVFEDLVGVVDAVHELKLFLPDEANVLFDSLGNIMGDLDSAWRPFAAVVRPCVVHIMSVKPQFGNTIGGHQYGASEESVLNTSFAGGGGGVGDDL